MKKRKEQIKDILFVAHNIVKSTRHYETAAKILPLLVLFAIPLWTIYITGMRPIWLWVGLYFFVFGVLAIKELLEYRKVRQIIAARKPNGAQGSK